MKKLIIPAAGFGKRVGLSTSKELLFYKNEVKPILLWSLDLAKNYDFIPVVISRKDKIDLNHFLDRIQQEYKVEICLIEESDEWPHTVLQSQLHWGDINILVLPDTRFNPITVISKIEQKLKYSEVIFGTFDVQEFSTWGIVTQQGSQYGVVEKPVETVDGKPRAWGLIGFRKELGIQLFEALQKSSQNHQIEMLSPKNIDFVGLDGFIDITRTKENLFEGTL